jgi:glycosyltransferase involved in cell wall biosynthesis
MSISGEPLRPVANVAMVVYSFSGGAGRSIQVLLETLRGMGHRVHLITRRSQVEYSDVSFPVHFIEPGDGRQETRWLAGILERIERDGPLDLLLTNTYSDLAMTRPLRHRAHRHIVRVAMAERLRRFGPLRRAIKLHHMRRLFARLDVVTVSRGLADELTTVIRARPRSIVTIYNPFDFEEIGRRSREPDAAMPRCPYVICVGHLVPRKRHDLVIRAFASLPRDYHLVILGDGRLAGELRGLADSLGLGDRVQLPGFRENPYNWIRGAELLVLASEFEGFPRVLIEALAVETPVVSVRCEYGPDEILTGDLSRFLVPTGDLDALAAAMVRALASYPPILADTWRRFGNERSAQEYLALIDGGRRA